MFHSSQVDWLVGLIPMSNIVYISRTFTFQVDNHRSKRDETFAKLDSTYAQIIADEEASKQTAEKVGDDMTARGFTPITIELEH